MPVQAASPITSSGLNTQVSLPSTLPSGKVQYDITGGTRPVGGTNLFHSFGDFNVPHNNIANFLNTSGFATSNILGRVTGGNISNIFGAIQTTGFGNANLFLMNPAGFLFGPNATVNVGGMVSFTSADYLRLADGVRFKQRSSVYMKKADDSHPEGSELVEGGWDHEHCEICLATLGPDGQPEGYVSEGAT